MLTKIDCHTMREYLPDFVDEQVSGGLRGQIQGHLVTCQACRYTEKRLREVRLLLQGAVGSAALNPEFVRETSRKLQAIHPHCPPVLAGRLKDDGERMASAAPAGFALWYSATPWWAISMALHVLIILLLGLITMTIGQAAQDDTVIVLTSLERRPELAKLEEQPARPDAKRDILKNPVDVAPTDPASTVQSNIVVPPDILAQAELGDHFETINLDRPDTHSAFGNPDARMFHSVSGNDEPEGGGGMGGASLLDDLIGVGGASSPGSGGGWGGGIGTGVGIGTGSGKGSFGSRNGGGRKLMVLRHGGSKATESAVDKGLEWLARHQEPDGSWDYRKYELTYAPLKNLAPEVGDVGITGLALLAFLGAGHTEKMGRYKENVKRATAWLLKLLGPKTRWSNIHQSNYSQGIGALALSEAAAMGRNPEVRDAAQRAANGVTEGQIKTGPSEYQAWYYVPNGAQNDTSVSGWNVMALKSAKVAGLHVDVASFEGALNWIQAAQELQDAPKGDEAEYWEGGMMWYQGTLQNPHGHHKNMALTAIAAAARLFVGGEKTSSAGVAGPCNLMKRPENLPTQWPANLYYWYYGTLVMFQKGGDHWSAWNQALKKTLVENQRKDGDYDGSWDVHMNELGLRYGGRVMSTALACMCLEVYYRYLPLNR